MKHKTRLDIETFNAAQPNPWDSPRAEGLTDEEYFRQQSWHPDGSPVWALDPFGNPKFAVEYLTPEQAAAIGAVTRPHLRLVRT